MHDHFGQRCADTDRIDFHMSLDIPVRLRCSPRLDVVVGVVVIGQKEHMIMQRNGFPDGDIPGLVIDKLDFADKIFIFSRSEVTTENEGWNILTRC